MGLVDGGGHFIINFKYSGKKRAQKEVVLFFVMGQGLKD